MQKFLSLLFSRRALAVVGVLVLALLVWFVGPLVSFDTLRPLASVGSRVVTIALLLMLLVLWLVNWSMSIIGISVLCLAIGFVTPLLALGDVHPFAPLWVRLTLIGFILLMYALYGLYRLWRALRMDEQLLRRFLHPRGEEVPVAGEIKADLRTVNHIVTQAIRQLRQLRVDMPGWRKIFEGKRFLYELPWFMVVGSPGDGKTTALLNTGLQFPLAEQMEQTSRILTVPGGGTLHCDWWFTNEAVLIDTAGRYARHDDGREVSAAQRNAGEWQGFLGLLRKHRPGAPLNGVILTLNVADLTAQSPAERLAACAALRARLADLRETLGIRFPVYLVVTKMDLLPGFSDYFRTLTSHLRAQIWGFSLPYSRRRKAGDPQALHAACAQELARLTLRLDQGLDNSHQRNAGSASSLTAGYSSSLALSRNGLFWGGGQDGEPASGMAVNVESEGDEGSSGKVVSVRGSSQPFSLGFGQQSLLLMEGYNATEVTIEDAGVSSQGMAGVKAGGGSRRYFLTPGHLLVHNISASMSRLYVGRVLDKDGRPLLDAQPLNHPFLSLGPSGRFSLQSEHKESSLWLLSKNRILRCPMSVHKRRDVMQVVGDVRCELSDVDALPQALQISPRVIRLLNVAGLLRHAVQEA